MKKAPAAGVFTLLMIALSGATGLAAGASSVFAAGDGAATAGQRGLLIERRGRPGPVYDLAVRLSRKGQHKDARMLLLAIEGSEHPLVLNQLGFLTRRLGEPGKAVAYYEKALEIEPGFLQARHYLGVAWLQLDQLENAKKQLAALDALCGKTCEVYVSLEQAIAAHASGAPAPGRNW